MAKWIGELDIDALAFGPLDCRERNKSKVEIFRDATKLDRGNKLNMISLCMDTDTRNLLDVKFNLDSVRDDSNNPLRRGLVLKVEGATAAALHQLDERIVRAAVENSKEWFGAKQQLSEEVVRDRYQPLIKKIKDCEDDFVKITVKCPGVQYPTELHLYEDGKVRKNGASIDDLRGGAKAYPVVSASYGIWLAGGRFGLLLQAEQMIITPCAEDKNDLPLFTRGSEALEVVSDPAPAAAAGRSSPPPPADDGEPPPAEVTITEPEEADDAAM